MFKNYFVLLLCAHIIGEFYVNDLISKKFKMAKFRSKKIKLAKKNSFLSGIIIYNLGYLAIILFLYVFIFSMKLIFLLMLFWICHIIIHLTKSACYKNARRNLRKIKSNSERNYKDYIIERQSFILAQLANLIVIFIFAGYLAVSNMQIIPLAKITNFFDEIGIAEWPLLSKMLVLLMIHKPANALIQKLLIKYKPNKNNISHNNYEYCSQMTYKGKIVKYNGKVMKYKDNSIKVADKKAGRYIGTLERIIMFIFIFLKQYQALGLVLTAKSIARYDRISNDEVFAEYYLLGTLLSSLIVIVSTFIVI